MTVKGRTLKEGDWISIDGTTGQVLEGKIQTKPSEVLQVLIEKTLDPKDAPVYQTFAKVMTWADKYRTLKIRTNADQPDQSAQRRGLRRRGHRPLPDRAHVLRRGQDRPDAGDDPGRHARGPQGRPGQAAAAPAAGFRRHLRGHGRPPGDHPDDRSARSTSSCPTPRRTSGRWPPRWASRPREGARTGSSRSTNSTRCSGHRGCRLGIIYPEITEMQARAIFEAAADTKKKGINVEPEVMIPLVGNVKELANQEKIVRPTAEAVMKEKGVKFKYLVGTMIEIPRGALTADEIAGVAEFFSFGTNDLTQTTLGVSRDDAGPLPDPVRRDGDLRQGPVRSPRPGRRGPAHDDGRREGPRDPARDQARHLRRARRRAVQRRVLPPDRPELRQLLARSGCPSPGWPRRGRPCSTPRRPKRAPRPGKRRRPKPGPGKPLASAERTGL